MAHTITARNLRDDLYHTDVHIDAIDTSGGVAANTVVFDSSAAKYGLLTLTLSGAPTTNFCIGEVLTCDSLYLRVQDYTSGGTTVVVYRVTSATDITPVGLANNGPTVSSAIVGSVSGTSSVTTHGSTTGSHSTKSVSVSRMAWSVSTTHTMELFFDGSSAVQNIAHLTGNGNFGPFNHFVPITMGSAAGNTNDVLGNIEAQTFGSSTNDSSTVQIEIKKLSGYGAPLYAKNLSLGYNQGQHGFGDTY